MDEVGFQMMIRLAIVTYGISHFEVPLFRLIAKEKGVDLKVYYILSPKLNNTFDLDYNQGINWGEDMLEGYTSEQCENSNEIFAKIVEWLPDVVLMYGYMWPGALSLILRCRIHGISLILRGTLNYYKDPRNTFLQGLRRPFRWPIFHLFDALHYGGTYSYKVLRRALVPRKRLFFAPYSVDSPHFVTASDQLKAAGIGEKIRKELGWADCFPVILFIGQLSWFKGPDIAAQVFQQYYGKNKKARLLVVGNGVKMDEIKSLLGPLVDQGVVHFEGFVPSKQTIPYYLASHIVLFTSRYETWARSVNEAMLCKRPCIVNRIIPSAGGLVDDEINGYVVEPKIDDYCNVLKKFCLLSSSDRDKLGDNARKSAKKFSYEANMESIVECIRYAAAKKT